MWLKDIFNYFTNPKNRTFRIVEQKTLNWYGEKNKPEFIIQYLTVFGKWKTVGYDDDPWTDGSRFDSLEHARGHLKRVIGDYPKEIVIEIYGKENQA